MRQRAYDYSYALKRERQRLNTHICITVICVFVFLSLFFKLILFPVRVNSDSMESDIVKGGAVFVTPLVRTPKRGDVVYLSRSDGMEPTGIVKLGDSIVRFFTAQQININSSRRITSHPCLRRVLALPGDSIYMKDYVLYVKPAGTKQYLTEFELASKPYSVHIYAVPVGWDGLGSCGTIAEHKMGKDEYFVLADNRIEAADSRVWGPLTSSRIKGKAIFQYLPFNKLKLY